MTVNEDSCSSGSCGKFEAAMDILSKKWTGFIVHRLLAGPLRYKDLASSLPQTRDKILCDRLKELEELGLVDRKVYPESPVRIEYELTPKGRMLKPVLEEIEKWASHL